MSLDFSVAKQLVDDHSEQMIRALAITWKVIVIVGREESPTMASADLNFVYQTATIRMDPMAHSDEDEFLDTLRHELLHVMHGAFEGVRGVATQFLKGDRLDAVVLAVTVGLSTR